MPKRVLRKLDPRSWPIRWRLAAVSAGLTMVILMGFGALIGQVATHSTRDDFNREVSGAAQSLASEVRISYQPPIVYPTGVASSGFSFVLTMPNLNDFVRSDDASARIYGGEGTQLRHSHEAADMGSPALGLTTYDGMRVSTAAVNNEAGELVGYVQYGRDLSHVDNTVDRLWLLVAAGVFGGTLLAGLAGLTIAGRAMRPVSQLTASAREIAETGDPSRHMPAVKADDEVGKLASTLEQMLRSLDAARAERESAMQRQREFVADASHELRTPLTSILANLELLEASLDSAGQMEDREMVDSALRSSRRMSRLVADLLLLARADAGRVGDHRSCDLAEIVGNAAVEIAPIVGDRALDVHNERAVSIQGNADELHRMIVNLLDNAVRYTPPTSSIELRLSTKDGRAIVEVADDGPGIPPERREQVFDRFVRLEGPADVSVGSGTGLGLAIVRAVAGSHSGKVEVTESRHGGALLRVSLPLASAGERAGTLETL